MLLGVSLGVSVSVGSVRGGHIDKGLGLYGVVMVGWIGECAIGDVECARTPASSGEINTRACTFSCSTPHLQTYTFEPHYRNTICPP